MSTDPKLPEEFILEIMKEQVKLVIILAILSLVCVFEPIYALDTNKTVVASDKLGTPQVSAAKTEIKSTAANSTEINKSNISTPAKGEISTDKNEEKKSKVSGGSADPWSNDADNFDEYFAEVVVNDPYEKFNRVMFAFNDKLDRFIIRPIAIGYNTVLPQPVINSVDNFLPILLL